MTVRCLLLASVVLTTACASASGHAPRRSPGTAAATAPRPAGPPDPLGPRPEVPSPPPFVPPVPVVFPGPGGSTVWLVERHELPLVAVALVVPYGSSSDPPKLAGLAHVTADMLDEGAGARDALAFSSAVDDLGARLTSQADRETSVVSLEIAAARLPAGLGLLGDAVLRPRYTTKDFDRVTSLWKNALRARGDDPNDVARVVTAAAFWGREHPYGRPTDGTLTTADNVKRPAVLQWHQAVWRPDVATFVVVGDVTRAALTTQLTAAFAGWKAPPAPPPPVVAAPPPEAPGLRTVVVDRPEAPQVVLSVMREGVSAANKALPRLELLNLALGGSFTSRLNQNLREDHGWTYGVRSRFVAQRSSGAFTIRAAIRTDALADAIGETRKEVARLVAEGLPEADVAKVKAQARADAIQSYGSLRAIALGLAANAGAGLGADADAKTLTTQASARPDDLAPLSRMALPIDAATYVLVGPRAPIEAALAAAKLPAPESRDVNGAPTAEASAKTK